jgi:hypothetical protein
MKWDFAYKLCSSLNMHLPTIDELKKAYKLRIIELSPNEGGYYYWSSTPYDVVKLNVARGYADRSYRDDNYDVRCRR